MTLEVWKILAESAPLVTAVVALLEVWFRRRASSETQKSNNSKDDDTNPN